MSAHPAFVSKSRFADEVLGCARSYVSKLAKQGKLVVNEHGLVNVHASLALIKDGYGAPERGRALLHAQRKGQGTQPAPDAPSATDPPEQPTEPLRPAVPDNRERNEFYAAEKNRLDYEERCGSLMPVADVHQVVANAFTAARNRLEGWPQRLAPLLAPMADEGQLRATLADEVQALLEDMSHTLALFLRAQPPADATTH